MLDQILVDRDRVTALGGLRLDEAPIRLAHAARSARPGGHFQTGGRFWVGGHFGRGGTLCRLGRCLARDPPNCRSVEAGLPRDPPLLPSQAQEADD